MTTERDFTLSFYDDYGTLSMYAKQCDTQRIIQFQFTEEGIIPIDRTDLHVYIRGKFSDNTIISPYEIDPSDIHDDYITFNIPSYMLAIPGKAAYDLVFAKSETSLEFENGDIKDKDEIQILSTHNFNIYIEPLPTCGGSFTSVQDDQVDVLTKLVIKVEKIIDRIEMALYWQTI